METPAECAGSNRISGRAMGNANGANGRLSDAPIRGCVAPERSRRNWGMRAGIADSNSWSERACRVAGGANGFLWTVWRKGSVLQEHRKSVKGEIAACAERNPRVGPVPTNAPGVNGRRSAA